MDKDVNFKEEYESIEDIKKFFKKARSTYRELIKELLEYRPSTTEEVLLSHY